MSSTGAATNAVSRCCADAARAELATSLDRYGIDIRELADADELATFATVIDASWGRTEPWVDPDRLAARVADGAYLVGMFVRSTNVMVGGTLGYADPTDPEAIFLDVTGILEEYRGRGWHRSIWFSQRSWALDHGYPTIRWTFDPALRHTAWTSIETRAVEVTGYVVNAFGTPDASSINGFDDTDRLRARWDLCSDAVLDALAKRRVHPDEEALRRAGAIDLIDDDGHGVHEPAEDRPLLCATPDDLLALRRTDPEAASRWRLSVRNALEPALAAGWRITGMTPSGRHVLERP